MVWIGGDGLFAKINTTYVCRRWHKNLQSLAFIIINNRQGNSTHSQSSPGKPLNKDRALRNFVALSSTEAFALQWMIGASDSIIYSNILIEANVVHYLSLTEALIGWYRVDRWNLWMLWTWTRHSYLQYFFTLGHSIGLRQKVPNLFDDVHAVGAGQITKDALCLFFL